MASESSEARPRLERQQCEVGDGTGVRSRNWCFTDFELLDFEVVFERDDALGAERKMRYLCVGQEKCPETGLDHQQGWVQFTTPRRLRGVKLLLGSDKVHVEPCRGNEPQNDKYCQKSGDFQTWGKYVRMGQRKDLESIKALLEDGATMYEVADANFATFCRFHKAFGKYKEIKQIADNPKWRNVRVVLIQGPTGTGKTRYADGLAGYKIQGSQLTWWDGYEGEEIVLIDEYNNDVRITQLLALLDGYKLRLAIKGGFTWANWKTIYITTNLRYLHEKAGQGHRDALARRITKTWNLWNAQELKDFEVVVEEARAAASYLRGLARA